MPFDAGFQFLPVQIMCPCCDDITTGVTGVGTICGTCSRGKPFGRYVQYIEINLLAELRAAGYYKPKKKRSKPKPLVYAEAA